MHHQAGISRLQATRKILSQLQRPGRSKPARLPHHAHCCAPGGAPRIAAVEFHSAMATQLLKQRALGGVRAQRRAAAAPPSLRVCQPACRPVAGAGRRQGSTGSCPDNQLRQLLRRAHQRRCCRCLLRTHVAPPRATPARAAGISHPPTAAICPAPVPLAWRFRRTPAAAAARGEPADGEQGRRRLGCRAPDAGHEGSS